MNKRLQQILIAAFLIAPLLKSDVSAQVINPQWPQITQQNKPWARWWWQGSAVTPKGLTWMMQEYQKVGLGGLEITPIYGVKGAENQFIDFLSPKWIDMLKFTLAEGQRLGLGIDMAMASGWPFGGPWVTNEDASKYVAHKTYQLKAGEKLNEKIEFIQTPIVRVEGEKIDISKLKEPIASNPNLQLHAFDQVRFQKPLPLQALIAYSDRGLKTDLTAKVGADGKLDWKAPAGNWTLYAIFEGWHGKMVERAGPGGEGYAIDHFSHQATSNYLKHFDEAFKGSNLTKIRSFFNDSYEVDDASGEASWTPLFFEEFKKRRGYELKDHLPALFSKNYTDQDKRVLCDYRETISDLLLDNYTKTWHEWAQKRGGLIRNQAHGSPANILDLYAATDIPEIEGTDIFRIKFASSAANVTGKPLISSESATWENEHFLSKLGDVKKRMDIFLLGGVNHTFYHGVNYTPQDAAWPGWLFYAAVHFTPNNTFWDDFSKLNNYVAHVQSFMQQGKANNDVLLYLPIYDAFSKPGKSLLQHFDGIDHGFKGTVLEESAIALQRKGYGFDFISDRQIEQTTSKNELIATGGVTYQTVVVPACEYIPLETFNKLFDLAKNGANIVLFKKAPDDISGLKDLELKRKAFKAMLAQLQFKDTPVSGVKRAAIGKGAFVLSEDLDKALSFSGVARESMVDQGLAVIRRKYNKGAYYFLVNNSERGVDGWVNLQTAAKSVAVFNPMTEKTGYAAVANVNDASVKVYLQLAAGESCILQTSEEVQKGAIYPYAKMVTKPQEVKGTWDVKFVKGGPVLPEPVKTSKLMSWTEFADPNAKNFSGTAKYSISVKKPVGEADAWQLDLGNAQESVNVKLNGKVVGTAIGPDYKFEIPAELFGEDNLLEIEVSNSMANRIIYMDQQNMPWKKFYNINMPAHLPENRGVDGKFSAKNWTPRASGLTSPATLTGVKRINPQVIP